MKRSIRVDVRVVSVAAFAAACCATGSAWADDPKSSDLDSAVQSTLVSGDPISNAYDDVQKWKQENGIPIEVGAWHWWHSGRKHKRDFGYGQDGLRGTYFWYVKADPETSIGDGVKVGAHIDLRMRDSEDDRFRPFYESNLWLWEAYIWAGSDDMKAKVGKVWRRFGLDWDGSWYGNVAYFDGWKLDPDWGASVETNWGGQRDGFTAPTFIQGFVAEDKVNGSISGADAESAEHSLEELSANVRTVPTWEICPGSSLALGLSGHIGHIENRDRDDETIKAAAVDLTWTYGDLKVFGEIMWANGERNPVNYVTGGPSSHAKDWLIGGQYQLGPVAFRTTISHGEYENPGGEQVLYLMGVTLAVTKNVDVYLEYVRWDTQASGVSPHGKFEDGFSLVLNWRF